MADGPEQARSHVYRGSILRTEPGLTTEGMSSAIVRQWWILSMLPVRPRRIDTGVIEAGLRSRGIDVHRRTIQRDLLDLAEVFPIVADDRAKPFGWRWADEAAFVGPVPHPKGDASTVDVTLRVARAALSTLMASLAMAASVEILAPAELRARHK